MKKIINELHNNGVTTNFPIAHGKIHIVDQNGKIKETIDCSQI